MEILGDYIPAVIVVQRHKTIPRFMDTMRVLLESSCGYQHFVDTESDPLEILLEECFSDDL
jgi:hypothetical protein